MAQRPIPSWEENSREGRDSVVTTSSSSASSSETLKWHGSMSDVSVSSGLPPRVLPIDDRWQRDDCLSDVGSSNSAYPPRRSASREKWRDASGESSLPETPETRHAEPTVKSIRTSVSGILQVSDAEKKKQEWEEADKFRAVRPQVPIGQNGEVEGSAVGSKQLIAHSARVQTPQRHLSESVLYLDRDRNQRKLFPVGTSSQQSQGQGQNAIQGVR